MAFDFPPAQDGLRVTNPESGVTYVYREKYQSWIIEAVDNKAVRVFTECCTPCDAAQGDIWFNPCTNCLHLFHDGAWEPVIDCETSAGTYKGEKQFASELPTTGNENGDAWIVLEEAAIYVWSSNGWVRADHTDTKELRDLIQKEEDERKAADQLLAGQISREAVKRKAEDDKLWEALEEETEARKSGDQAVTDLLNDCCTKSEDGLKDLEDALADEVNSREDADKALQDQIDANGKELEFANDRIDQEVNDRIAGDDQLRDDISDEASQREAADNQLLALVREKECKWMGEVQSVSDLPSTRYDWTPLTHFCPHTVYSITWGPDHYIAGSSNGHVWTSDDGQYWERRNVGIAYNSNVLATFYANGVWLIGGENGLVSRSVDGITWANYYSTTTSNVQDFAYGANTYVYVTDGGVVATSSDGVSWTKQDATVRWGVHGIDSILSVTYSEGLAKFVACTARGMILISDTGVGWDLIDPGLMGDGKILTIAATEWHGKSLLVAGGDFAKRLLYSEDAINWVTAPQNYFGDAFPTDLKDTGTVLLAALSDGRAGFASDDRVSSWTFESTGAGERLLAIEHAPQNSNIALSEGNWVVAGNFGQAFVRLPGNGLESGDTWAVRDEMALYTWSSLGWITGGSGGGGSAPGAGVQQLVGGSGILLTPSNGKGIVQVDVDTNLAYDDSEIRQLVADEEQARTDGDQALQDQIDALGTGADPDALKDIEESIEKLNDGLEEEIKAREEKDQELEDKIDAIEVGGNYFGSAPPSDPDTPAGTFFIDETTLKMYVYDGDAWIQVGGGG